ncbi:MAG: histone acetyltransferase, partial [Proteobacteria bacterium]|nr:histone acetyltransferase [Pseudomonadota bacterium]
WTQSWQAAEFYEQLGYVEFARFDDFPKGHQRIGFRKLMKPG